jgi:hypothetical protein
MHGYETLESCTRLAYGPVNSSRNFQTTLSDRVKWQAEYQSTYLTTPLSFGMSTVRYNIINCLDVLTKKNRMTIYRRRRSPLRTPHLRRALRNAPPSLAAERIPWSAPSPHARRARPPRPKTFVIWSLRHPFHLIHLSSLLMHATSCLRLSPYSHRPRDYRVRPRSAPQSHARAARSVGRVPPTRYRAPPTRATRTPAQDRGQSHNHDCDDRGSNRHRSTRRRSGGGCDTAKTRRARSPASASARGSSGFERGRRRRCRGRCRCRRRRGRSGDDRRC